MYYTNEIKGIFTFHICKKKKTNGSVKRRSRRALLESTLNLHSAEAGVDFAEHVADDRAEDHESRDNNDGNQNKNQRILNQALAFLFGGE